MENTQRQIKFRAWDNELKRWEFWVLPDEAGFMAGRFDAKNRKTNRFSRSTLEQFTDLLDKNGTEIYEGDIVRWKTELGHHTEHVRWNENLACFTPLPGDEAEVIGDIHTTPDLLKPTNTTEAEGA